MGVDSVLGTLESDEVIKFCSFCDKDITRTHYFPCAICPEFKLCSFCFNMDFTVLDTHALLERPSAATRERDNDDDRLKAIANEILEIMEHASRCWRTRGDPCSDPRCANMKGLFKHLSKCQVRVSGDCKPCKRAWLGIVLHSNHCEKLTCMIPHCRDVKDYKAKYQQRFFI